MATVARKGSLAKAPSGSQSKPRSGKVYSIDSGKLGTTEKINMVREGITKYQLTGLKDRIAVDFDQLAELLGTSRATLINKKADQRFDAGVSERIMLINDLIGFGLEVFGDEQRFNLWLKTPSRALKNVTPLSMMDTFYGIQEIRSEIGRIAHGIY